MNKTVSPPEIALAMYETACESHMRRDWREACHALAKALKAQLLASSAPVTQAPVTVEKPVKPAKATQAPKGYNMTAEGLTRALKMLHRLHQGRNNYPICDHVLIQAIGDSVLMVRTDLDREMVVTIDAPNAGHWSAVIDAKTILAILSKARGEVTMKGEEGEPYETGSHNARETVRDTSLTLSGAVSTTLKGRPVVDFPRMATKGEPIALPCLQDALAFTKCAISDEATRYYLNGVCVRQRGPVLDVVSTDGHRLQKVEIVGHAGDVNAIIPRAVVADILAMGAGYTDVTASHVTHKAGAVFLVAKLIDGAFPDYMRVIPTDGDPRTFWRGAMVEALNKVIAVRASDKKDAARPVKLAIDGEGVCEIVCKNMDGVELRERIPMDGPALEIGFDARYILDALSAAQGDRIEWLMTDAPSPTLLRSQGSGDRLTVLMPLRV